MFLLLSLITNMHKLIETFSYISRGHQLFETASYFSCAPISAKGY